MKQAKFTADFDHRTPGKIIAYKAGWEGEVTEAAYREAVKAKAVEAPKPTEGKKKADGKA